MEALEYKPWVQNITGQQSLTQLKAERALTLWPGTTCPSPGSDLEPSFKGRVTAERRKKSKPE